MKSDEIKYLFGRNLEIVITAPIMANTAVKDEDKGVKLFVNERCSSRAGSSKISS